ncbi:MAG: hypothetical protein ACTSYB_18260 [Candidatus Helarchaeota archaeon]
MPKKTNIHIVTDLKYKKLLEKFSRKYGSMTKAFEVAIETFEKNEHFSSCTDCKIKAEYEQIKQFQTLLNTITLTFDNIQDLIKYLKGEYNVQQLLNKAREYARRFVDDYFPFLNISKKNSYENLLTVVKEWKKRTRLFKIIQSDDQKKQVLARVNIFEELPIFAAMSLIGYLEALNFTFDFDIVEKTIFLKWLSAAEYIKIKDKIEEKIQNYVLNAQKHIKPYFIKQGFIPILPDLFEWLVEKILQYETIPIDSIYRFINQFLGGNSTIPKTARDWAIFLANILLSLNYIEHAKFQANNQKNTFHLHLSCISTGFANLILQMIIIILAKYGWKLDYYRLDYKELDMKFFYIGSNDPSILEPLYLVNFPAFLNQRFQSLCMIPIDEYDDLTQSLYDFNKPKFCEIFYKQGLKFANAIKLLGKNDLSKMRQIGLQVIPQIIRITQKDPQEIRFLVEPQKLTVIFKRMDLVNMAITENILIGIMKGLGYQNIKSRYIENIITFEFLRPESVKIST